MELSESDHGVIRPTKGDSRDGWKIWPSCPAFENHSRSSEPTRIDPPHWLPISVP